MLWQLWQLWLEKLVSYLRTLIGLWQIKYKKNQTNSGFSVHSRQKLPNILLLFDSPNMLWQLWHEKLVSKCFKYLLFSAYCALRSLSLPGFAWVCVFTSTDWENWHTDMVQLFLKHTDWNIDLNAGDNNRMTVFMIACENGHTDVVELFLYQSNSKIDLNTRDWRSYTAFMLACRKGKVLLDYSAEIFCIYNEFTSNVHG